MNVNGFLKIPILFSTDYSTQLKKNDKKLKKIYEVFQFVKNKKANFYVKNKDKKNFFNKSFYVADQDVKENSNLKTIKKFIAYLMCGFLSDYSFEIVKKRLGKFSISSKSKDSAKKDDNELNTKNSLRIMSRHIDGYNNLSTLKVKDGDNCIGFIEYIKKYNCPPEKVILSDSKEKKEIELKGIMGVLAVACSLADKNVIKNTGYVCIRDEKDKIIQIKVVKIDSDCSFQYENINTKNIMINDNIKIEWRNLSEKQKDEFLRVKEQNSKIIQSGEVFKYIFEDNYNKNSEINRLINEVNFELKEKFIDRIKFQSEIYKEDLKRYKLKISKLPNYFKEKGDLECDNKDYDKALYYYEKNLGIKIEKYGKCHNEIGKSYVLIAETEFVRGNFERAEKMYLLGLEIFENEKNYSDIAKSYNNLGVLYDHEGEYDKALEYCNKSLEIIKKTDSSKVALVYNNLGNVYYNKGEYNEAEKYHYKSLEIQEKTLPENHPDIAKSHNNLGVLYDTMGNYDEALKSYNKSLKIRRKILPKNYLDIAESYNNLGILYYNKGEYSIAEEYCKKSLEIQEKTLPKNHPDIAKSYNNWGNIYYNKYQYEKALEYYNKSLEIRKKILSKNHPDIAKSYNNLGNTYNNIGKYIKALKYCKKSLEIREKILPNNHLDIAENYNNLGNIYYNKRQYDEALKYYLMGVKIQKKILPNNHLDIAINYDNLGNVYYYKGDNDKALEYYKKSLEIRKKILSEDHLDIAVSYNSLGFMYYKKKDYHKAIEYYNKCLIIRQKILTENHPDVIESYNNLVIVLNFLMNEFQQMGNG